MSSVSTAFKVHYDQKLGGPIRPSWGERTMASGGGIDAPAATFMFVNFHLLINKVNRKIVSE